MLYIIDYNTDLYPCSPSVRKEIESGVVTDSTWMLYRTACLSFIFRIQDPESDGNRTSPLSTSARGALYCCIRKTS